MNTHFRKLVLAALLLSSPQLTFAKSDTLWYYDNDYVRLEPAETGAVNGQPATVDVKRLTDLLVSVQVKNDENKYVALLKGDESERLARIFVDGLQKAAPSQELVFFSTERRSEGLIPAKSAVAGRVFVADNKINLIIGVTRLEYLAYLNAKRTLPPYSSGSRTTASAVDLRADGSVYVGANNRHDWLAWGVTGDTPAAAPQADEAKPAPASTPASPAATKHDDQYYAQQEQRLRRLQHLHDQKLITEQEYQTKRQEILRDY